MVAGAVAVGCDAGALDANAEGFGKEGTGGCGNSAFLDEGYGSSFLWGISSEGFGGSVLVLLIGIPSDGFGGMTAIIFNAFFNTVLITASFWLASNTSI